MTTFEDLGKTINAELKVLHAERKVLQSPEYGRTDHPRTVPDAVCSGLFMDIQGVKKSFFLDKYFSEMLQPIIEFYELALSYNSLDIKEIWRKALVQIQIEEGKFVPDSDIDEHVKNFKANSYIAKELLAREYEQFSKIYGISPDLINYTIKAKYGELDYPHAFLEEALLNLPGGTQFFTKDAGGTLVMSWTDLEAERVSSLLAPDMERALTTILNNFNKLLPTEIRKPVVKEIDEVYLKEVHAVAKTFDPQARFETFKTVSRAFSEFLGKPLNEGVEGTHPSLEALMTQEDLLVFAKLHELANQSVAEDKPINSDAIYHIFQNYSVFSRFNVFSLKTTNTGQIVVAPTKVNKSSYDEIGGYQDNIRFFKNLFKDRELMEETNLILLVGPPGTGKTSTVNAAITQLPSNVKAMYLSGTGAALKYLQNVARVKPDYMILGIAEDIDTMVADRNTVGGSMCKHSLGAFLDLDSGEEIPKNFMVIATTNHPHEIDSALLRPGRTRFILKYNLPNIKERIEIATIYATKYNLPDHEKEIASATEGMSGDDIRSIYSDWHYWQKGGLEVKVSNLINEAIARKDFRETKNIEEKSVPGTEFG